MSDQSSNASAVAREVVLAVGRLESLSTLPCVAAKFLPELLQEHFSPPALANIIESDPALTARILAVAATHGIHSPGVRLALERLPADIVRQALLSVKVSPDSQSEDAPSGKDLLLHSLAVACCAESIAKIESAGVDSKSAYCAGLLHDIGKLALLDAMPKSFARIAAEARATQSGLQTLEQQHLGADHAILGKRLAQRWRLPNEIALAVWLHHSDTASISANMPQARIAQVVQLADALARHSGIGNSGSCDPPESIEKNANSLGISTEQLEHILRDLLGQIAEKSNVLGLDSPDAIANYCDAAHTAAAQFAARQSQLSAENHRLQIESSHLEFTEDFLHTVNSATGPIEIAENFATRWQTFYQTGMVCLYIPGGVDAERLDAVVIEMGHCRTLCLEIPAEIRAIPNQIAESFAVLDAHDHIDWLLAQLDVDFGAGRTKLIPLLSNGRAVGAIAFELNFPGDAALFAEKFEASCSIAGAVLDIALAAAVEQSFAERFAQLVSGAAAPATPETVQPSIPEPGREHTAADDCIEALAEMAAGAAHELNNPLAVISGRAQLLAETETDPQKRGILNQIHQNAGEASAVIADLMGFAEPPQPRAAVTDVRGMLDEAMQLVGRKADVEHINVQIEVAEDAGEVFVDSAQIASAIANVVVNAIESYRDDLGPIKITAESAGAGAFVKLQIMDLGCGMDEQTARKATQPFFSAKVAGRKRGMGLAYAARFAQINGGALEIESRPGEGTTVTIHLPTR